MHLYLSVPLPRAQYNYPRPPCFWLITQWQARPSILSNITSTNDPRKDGGGSDETAVIRRIQNEFQEIWRDLTSSWPTKAMRVWTDFWWALNCCETNVLWMIKSRLGFGDGRRTSSHYIDTQCLVGLSDGSIGLNFVIARRRRFLAAMFIQRDKHFELPPFI